MQLLWPTFFLVVVPHAINVDSTAVLCVYRADHINQSEQGFGRATVNIEDREMFDKGWCRTSSKHNAA